VRRSTGVTPYYLMYGHECVLPIGLAETTRMLSNWETVYTTEDLIVARMGQLERRPEEVSRAMVRLRRSRAAGVNSRNERYERRQRNRDFQVGDLVLVRDAARDNTHRTKEADRYWGPFRVVRQGANGAFALAELNGALKRGRFAGNRVRRWYPRQDIETEDRAQAGREKRFPEPPEGTDSGSDGPDHGADWDFLKDI
jgi:hypothetical protein